MYVVKNFEKWFKDHPEHAELKGRVLDQVRMAADEKDLVQHDVVEQILGPDLADRFKEEVTDSLEHQEIFTGWIAVFED